MIPGLPTAVSGQEGGQVGADQRSLEGGAANQEQNLNASERAQLRKVIQEAGPALAKIGVLPGIEAALKKNGKILSPQDRAIDQLIETAEQLRGQSNEERNKAVQALVEVIKNGVSPAQGSAQ
ncbi:hypothetical protein KGQ71_00635 [Patescibacteria group bacterium]|nr:hypothetical protein [Patescibacteria group bacterium]